RRRPPPRGDSPPRRRERRRERGGAVMMFDETVAFRCRYGSAAARVFGHMEVLWEQSEDDYQGSARVLAKDGEKYVDFGWSYGSCSGCDDWENRELTEEQVAEEMRQAAGVYESKEHLAGLLKMLEQRADEMWARSRHTDDIVDGLVGAIRAELGLPQLAPKVQHTPGPWRVGRDGAVVADTDEGTHALRGDDAEFYGGALVAESIRPANINLIAAAPEMYEALDPDALEAIADEIGAAFEHSARADALRVIAKKQRAAIAKARGEAK
ncbi:MAG: hypothetical protein ACK4N5_09180, partial [Myxococcales bacterium]